MSLSSLQFNKQKPELQDLVVENKTQRITADRAVQGSNFPNGPINVKLSGAGANECIDLENTKLHMRMSLTKADGTTPLTVDDGLAWCNNPVNALWQRIELLCNDQVIDSVQNNVAQCDTLALRQGKSQGWLDTVGRTLFMEPVLDDRVQRVSSNGKEIGSKAESLVDLGYDPAVTLAYTEATGAIVFSAGDTTTVFSNGDVISIDGNRSATIVSIDGSTQVSVVPGALGGDIGATAISTLEAVRVRARDSARVSQYEFVSHIPLPIFRTGMSLPPGNYSLRLYPHNSATWKYRCVESYAQKVPGTDYEVDVKEMYAMVSTNTLSKKIPDGKYHIVAENIEESSDTIVSSTGLQNYNYDVNPNADAISVAFQSNLATSGDTRYPETKFAFGDGGELGLTRLYINYAGRSVPSYQATPEFSSGVDYTTQMWADAYSASGLLESAGGVEGQRDWQERGAFYRYNFHKAPTDRSVRAQVYAQFDPSASAQDNNILVFHHSLMDAEFHVRDGVVADCRTALVM